MIGFLGRNDCRSSGLLFFAVAAACLFTGCSGESEKMVRKKLDVICADDLAAIIDSIAVEDLIERPYYTIVSYKQYTEGNYSRKAAVDFYFLKKVSVKVVRKYRYHASIGMWDRYYNKYVFLHDTTTGVSKK
ncbi:MAG: hypothetical protein JXA18_17545 [Chitinispirillaceae bacterium]|nr:hypothetical protein [Chitinispirillaceae bacterium]